MFKTMLDSVDSVFTFKVIAGVMIVLFSGAVVYLDVLQSNLEKRDARLEQKKVEIREQSARQLANDTSLQLKETQAKLLEAQQSATGASALAQKLDISRQDRHIPPENRQKFIDGLRIMKLPTIEVSSIVGDSEGFNFATEILSALMEAEKSVSSDKVCMVLWSSPPSNLVILSPPSNNPPEYIETLMELISDDLRMSIAARTDAIIKTGEIKILVGNKGAKFQPPTGATKEEIPR